MRGTAVDCVARGTDALGECPIWDDALQALWWIRGLPESRFAG